MNIQTVEQEPEVGAVFWWSNMFRSLQIAVYLPAGEASALRQMHMERDVTEATARSLAASLDLELFEIKVEQIVEPIKQNPY